MFEFQFFRDVFLGLLLVLCIRICAKTNAGPAFGVYRQKNTFYHAKFVVVLLVCWVIKIKNTFGLIYKQFFSQQGVDKIALTEQARELSSNRHAFDAVYLNGANSKLSWLVCGVARRRKSLANGYLCLKINGFSDKVLVSPRLPDTCMQQTVDEVGAFSVEGLKLTPIKPMEVCKVEYEGKMRFENDYSQIFNVKLDATWTTNSSVFNYNSDMHPQCMSRAMAKQLWSWELLKNVERYSHENYQQHGTIKGNVQINGISYPLHLDCSRNRCFGEYHDWKNVHRYVMHSIFLDNGDNITVGVICKPVISTSLEVGFVTIKKERKNYPVSSVNFELYQHGEYHNPPTDYALQFKAGGKLYSVHVKAAACTEYYIGEEYECKIFEQLCSFSVNGVRGWGSAEWQYRNLDGLPAHVPIYEKLMFGNC